MQLQKHNITANAEFYLRIIAKSTAHNFNKICIIHFDKIVLCIF